LGFNPYYLYGYVNRDTPADIISSFRQISYAALMDSNIEVEIIDTDRQKDHPVMNYLDLWPPSPSQRGGVPAAVLVSPDGQSLPVPLTEPNQSFEETLQSALDDILSSPKRQQILQQVSKSYAVVLLIEAADAQENKRASQAVRSAIKKISAQMEMMPKTIAHPPVLLVMDSESLSQEKILLWSLGLDSEEVLVLTKRQAVARSQPHAAVLYGRARWIGPLFKGEQITEDNLADILFVIGQDCECGLDQRWLQGTMLPARWDEKIQAQVAENLGFDPENPMVKVEMSRIITRGSSSYPGVPFGYQQLEVEPEPAANAPIEHPESKPRPDPGLGKPAPHTSGGSAPAPHRGAGPAWQKPLYFIAGLTVLIIAVGLFIVFRAARRNL
jgi:hypothetical protein